MAQAPLERAVHPALTAVLWLFASLAAGALAGCDADAPRLLEVRPPADTPDAVGPYRVTALTQGRIDGATLTWQRVGGEPTEVALQRKGDGLWIGDIPGAPRGSDVQLWLTARGPGGTARAPAEGVFGFRVLGPQGPCLVDSDCPDGEVCDRLRQVCKVPPETCRDDGDCPQDLICPAPGEACRFRPIDCERDATCGPGRVCRAGLCVLRPDCDSSRDCAAGQRCEAGQCVVPPECAQDAECPAARPSCEAGVCRPAPGCEADRDCPPGAPVCLDGQCVPAEGCREDADCPPDAPVCLDGQCVPAEGCRDDADCPPDAPLCVDGQCARAEGCRGDADCPADAPRCVGGRCLDTDACGGCPADQRCRPTPRPQCVDCLADGQCPGDQACDTASGRCVDGPRRRTCLPCGDGQPCGPGLLCVDLDGSTLTFCLPACVAGQCPRGFQCAGPWCEPFDFCYGGDCRADRDCESGVCQAGVCEPPQPCDGPQDCAADRRCVDGTCRPLQPFCADQGDCAAGTGCLAGRCIPSDPALGCAPCVPGDGCDSQGICLQIDPADPQPYCAPACGQGGCAPGQFCVEAGAGGLSLCVPELTCEAPPPACFADAFEPNDTLDSATRLATPFLADATACDDPDLYRLPDQATVIELQAISGRLRLRLRDSRRRLVDDRQIAAGQGLSVDGTAGGSVEITRVGDAPTEYALFVDTPVAPACDDDLFEPNDGPDDAVRIRFGADIAGVVCPGDADWFNLALRANEGGFLDLASSGPDPVTMRLVDGNGRAQFGPVRVDLGGGVTVPIAFNRSGLFLALDCAGCERPARYQLNVTR